MPESRCARTSAAESQRERQRAGLACRAAGEREPLLDPERPRRVPLRQRAAVERDTVPLARRPSARRPARAGRRDQAPQPSSRATPRPPATRLRPRRAAPRRRRLSADIRSANGVRRTPATRHRASPRPPTEPKPAATPDPSPRVPPRHSRAGASGCELATPPPASISSTAPIDGHAYRMETPQPTREDGTASRRARRWTMVESSGGWDGRLRQARRGAATTSHSFPVAPAQALGSPGDFSGVMGAWRLHVCSPPAAHAQPSITASLHRLREALRICLLRLSRLVDVLSPPSPVRISAATDDGHLGDRNHAGIGHVASIGVGRDSGDDEPGARATTPSGTAEPTPDSHTLVTASKRRPLLRS